MLAVAEAVPPAPLQETEYTVLFRGVTLALPLGAPPVENPPPEQLVAVVEFQLRVVLCRLRITEGLPARLAVGASDDDSPSMRRDRLSRDGRAWDKPMHEAPVQVQLVAPPVLARELPRSVAGAPGRSTEAGAELPTLRAAGHPGRPRGPAVGGRDPRSGEPRVNLRALPQEEIFIRGRPRSSPAYTWTEGVLTGDCRRVWNASSGGARGAPGRGDR